MSVTFMVMVKNPTGKITGLGSHTFAVAPRTGEYVTMDDEKGIGQAYRVKAVIHPAEIADTTGDLILEYIGTNVELRKNL